MIIALSIQHNETLYKLDIKDAFPQCEEKSELYTTTIEGFPLPEKPGHIALLQVLRSWYGSKQACRNFFLFMTKINREYGLHRDPAPQCCWKGKTMSIAVVVDDILISTSNEGEINLYVAFLQQKMLKPTDVKVWKQPASFLNIDITYGDGSIKLSQPGFIDKLLQVSEMQDANPRMNHTRVLRAIFAALSDSATLGARPSRVIASRIATTQLLSGCFCYF